MTARNESPDAEQISSFRIPAWARDEFAAWAQGDHAGSARLTQTSALAALIRWFVRQDKSLQAVILGLVEDQDRFAVLEAIRRRYEEQEAAGRATRHAAAATGHKARRTRSPAGQAGKPGGLS